MILDSFSLYIDLQGLDSKDVDKIRTEFVGRTQAQGRIIFRMNRTKFIKSLVHWIMDFYRVSATLSIVGLNEVIFKASLRAAEVRDRIRKSLKNQLLPSSTDPEGLKLEKHWKE